jgi:nucleolar protein 4
MTKLINKKGRVFLRNLPFKNLSEARIKELFAKFGEIVEVNIPQKETGEFRGFGFVQFNTREEALNAIKDMNNTKVDGRRIQVSLAVAKNDYNGDNKEEAKGEDVAEDNKKSEGKSVGKSNSKSDGKSEGKPDGKSKEKSERKTVEKSEDKETKPVLNDPTRTIFIRNLGFNTDETRLRDFFNTLQGDVLYAKVVKDHQTKTSKGTAFIMFRTEEATNEVLGLYHRYNNRNKHEGSKGFSQDDIDTSALNPFELDGRNLKLFPALSKDDADKRDKDSKSNKDEDKRNRILLYYGLSQSMIKNFLPENQDISDEDKKRREALIKTKKINFNKNPNFHVSDTRLTFRNLDKNIDEERLKVILKEKVDAWVATLPPAEKKMYNKVRKIKQIKLLRNSTEKDRDGNPKSKCTAFVETSDVNLAKGLVDTMSNLKLNKNSKKGLIIDFALEDARKINEREKKLKNIKAANKAKNKENEEEK